MTAAGAACTDSAGAKSRRLFEQIGDFLEAQRLEPNPVNYAFAHSVLANPGGPLAKAVITLTDGGVRLTMRDIEALGVTVSQGESDIATESDALVAQTQMQVEGFEDVVEGLRAETVEFGRNLAAEADALLRSHAIAVGDAPAVEEIVRITASMTDRVLRAEARLENATREAAELRTKLEEARDNARRDPLTELPNRRAFEEAFAARAGAGETLWLAVCDVDHFKLVNDRFGHLVGDRVLKAIGATLATTCDGHLVARYGGEEFVVLFGGVDAGSARATLESARSTIASKRYKLRDSNTPLGEVTFSAGLVPAFSDDTAKTVFQRADALLYRAKHDGRNCIRVG